LQKDASTQLNELEGADERVKALAERCQIAEKLVEELRREAIERECEKANTQLNTPDNVEARLKALAEQVAEHEREKLDAERLQKDANTPAIVPTSTEERVKALQCESKSVDAAEGSRKEARTQLNALESAEERLKVLTERCKTTEKSADELHAPDRVEERVRVLAERFQVAERSEEEAKGRLAALSLKLEAELTASEMRRREAEDERDVLACRLAELAKGPIIQSVIQGKGSKDRIIASGGVPDSMKSMLAAQLAVAADLHLQGDAPSKPLDAQGTDEMKIQLRNLLEEACDSGQLGRLLESANSLGQAVGSALTSNVDLSSTKSTAVPFEGEATEDFAARIRLVLDDSCKSGKLAQVLESMATAQLGKLEHAFMCVKHEEHADDVQLAGDDPKAEVLRLIQQVSSLRFNNVSLQKQVEGFASELDEVKKVNRNLMDMLHRSRPDTESSLRTRKASDPPVPL
jgi:hypothetical protein